MTFERRLSEERPRLSDRTWPEVRRELEAFLDGLKDSNDEGLPAGFSATTPSQIQAGVDADEGEPTDGWTPPSHVHEVETATPSHPTGSAASEGSGSALMRADATIQQGIVTAQGDILTHDGSVPVALSSAVPGSILTVLSNGSIGWAAPAGSAKAQPDVNDYILHRVVHAEAYTYALTTGKI